MNDNPMNRNCFEGSNIVREAVEQMKREKIVAVQDSYKVLPGQPDLPDPQQSLLDLQQQVIQELRHQLPIAEQVELPY